MSVNPIKPYQALQETANGLSMGLAWEIDAVSEIDARAQLAAVGIVRLAVLTDPYGNAPDTLCQCRSIEVEAKSPAKTTGAVGLYIAKALYSSEVLEAEPDGPAIWEIETSIQEQETDVDVNGAPLLNAADEPVTGARRPVAGRVYVATYIRTNMSFVDAANWEAQFSGCINSAQWFAAAPREVFCHALKPEQLANGNIKFTGRFEFKRTYNVGGVDIAPWRFAQIQRGRREKDGVDANNKPKYKNITDTAGKTVQEPVLLAADGTKLASGAAPVYMVKDLIPEADFNLLGNL